MRNILTKILMVLENVTNRFPVASLETETRLFYMSLAKEGRH